MSSNVPNGSSSVVGTSSRNLVRNGSGVSLNGKRRNEDQVRIVGDHYQLGAEIGRGGFGVVFSALDLRNGRSVAIKQVSLHEIDKDELLSIESEINLLRKLNHENIVKYHDTIKTQTWLFIVLEYMENGSLAQFMKRFGTLSETLVAMYIAQVLRGLAYLHEQGVLHRDVKGANILTTKDGLVKLADFGVAIKLNEMQKSNSVVGSPYWMAPEVIEMAGWSFASDIWSVGCTIIELLTTKPPYFDLAPMAALFRIVQDDHPPLPERISPALHDFIMKCFMKEPRLRASARELLLHPWISQIPKNKVEQSSQMVVENVTSMDDRDSMLNTIRLYAKEKQTESKLEEVQELKQEEEEDDDERDTTRSNADAGEANGSSSEAEDEFENWDAEFGIDAASSVNVMPRLDDLDENDMRRTVYHLSHEEVNEFLDDDWDEKDKQQEKHSSSTNQADEAANATSERPWIEESTGSFRFASQSAAERLASFSENEQDFDYGEFDKDEVVTRRQSFVAGEMQQPVRKESSLKAKSDSSDSAVQPISGQQDHVKEESQSGVRTCMEKMDAQEGFQENFFEEMDFEYPTGRETNQKTTSRIVELLALLDPSMEDQVILDACTQLREIFESNPLLRRELTSQAGVVPNIMEALEMKRMDVLCAVLNVVNLIVADNRRFQENLALVGLIPVIVKLTKLKLPYDSEERQFVSQVRLEAAKFVQNSCKTSSLTLQMFIACGGLPVLVDFLNVENKIVPKDKQMDLLRIALDGIFGVFNLQTIPKNDICRLFVKAGLMNRFVIVFTDIVAQFQQQQQQEDTDQASGDGAIEGSSSAPAPWALEELHKVCDVFVLFSQGDVVVKEHMCELKVLEGLLQALDKPSHRGGLLNGRKSSLEKQTHCQSTGGAANSNNFATAMMKILKSIRNLSMEPMTLEKLDRAGTIPTLVRLVNEQEEEENPQAKEVQNIVLQAMFYLCRINRNRQTHAAQAGLIPFLQRVVSRNSPLKQFALPILCDLAHASPTARAHLWSCDGVSLFLELLDDRYWQIDAIKSISVWLIHDTVKIENVLLSPTNLMKLITCFRNAQENEFENLLEPLLEMITRSVRLNQSLGRSSLFVIEILSRLGSPKAIVRKNLLKMLKSLFESHTAPTQFVVEFNLHPAIFALAQDDNMILVKEIASQLLQAVLVAAGAI